jgi:hypothetical protein
MGNSFRAVLTRVFIGLDSFPDVGIGAVPIVAEVNCNPKTEQKIRRQKTADFIVSA